MLKIRLQMTGRRNDRHFRIIVVEHTAGPKSGKYVEKVGYINPRTKKYEINLDRVKYWMSVGAKPTDRVYNMLVDEGVIEGPKKNVLPRKSPIKKEGEKSEQESAQEAQSGNESEEEADKSSGEENSEQEENKE